MTSVTKFVHLNVLIRGDFRVMPRKGSMVEIRRGTFLALQTSELSQTP